jgi:hypothetical protein
MTWHNDSVHRPPAVDQALTAIPCWITMTLRAAG